MPDFDITKTEGVALLKEFVERLRRNILKLLQERGMTQKELGERIDKNNHYIHYILHDPLPNPSSDGLIKIAHVFGIDITELLKTK